MKNNIKIKTIVTYLKYQSSPSDGQYAYAYTIIITNDGEVGAQLLSRHWKIKDETGHIENIIGEGVVGKQPHLAPGETFQYSSGALIKTSTGIMEGKYNMINDDGNKFTAQIPEFILSEPYILH